MTTIQPTLQKPTPPSLQATLDQHKREVQMSINCARIGVIKAFDAANQTVTVAVAQQQVSSVSPQGVRTIMAIPELYVLPVVFPSGGGFTLTFPVKVGDECLVVFNDRELDNWLTSGAGSTPTTGRLHDLSDGIAIVGLRSNPRALTGVSTTAVQIRSDDQQTLIEIAPGKISLIADEVVIHGRNKATFDAGGTGFVYTPGQMFTYTDGVPTTDSVPTPPEVPT